MVCLSMFPVSCVVACLGNQPQVVKEHMPDEAATVFEKCINEKALVLSGKVKPVRHPRPSVLFHLIFLELAIMPRYNSADPPFTVPSVPRELMLGSLTRSTALQFPVSEQSMPQPLPPSPPTATVSTYYGHMSLLFWVLLRRARNRRSLSSQTTRRRRRSRTASCWSRTSS